MTQEERYNTRDRSYSAWHRRNSTRRFTGIEDAQLLAMIDLDASLYVEYDDGTKEPLALIETAQDIGQPYKTATVTRNLAIKADLPCYVVLYKLADWDNPADTRFKDIVQFRVRELSPTCDYNWRIYTPDEWAKKLLAMRRFKAEVLDREYEYDTVPF